MDIVVLCGGLSNERDVSISSGTDAARALRGRGHRVLLVDLFFGFAGDLGAGRAVFDRPQEDLHWRVGEQAPDLHELCRIRQARGGSLIGPNVIELCRLADIVFLALHGEEGENGKLQAALDLAGVKYTGSGYLGSAIAMDKELTKIMLTAAGIATPPGMLLHRDDPRENTVGYPCVVKPCSGGSSVGVSIVHSREAFLAALDTAFEYENSVLVERYIAGREFTVGLMDGKAMPAIEIIPKSGFYDYKNKYQAGLTQEVCPAPLSEEDTQRLQRLAEATMAALHVDVYCRCDYIMDADGTFYCLEANTLPGMTPTSLIPQMARAQGYDYAALCEQIIAASLKRYEEQTA